ncbi:MAG TPA: hypothetical protein VI814_01900 [Candidatus Limnocylindria bacterium]
MGLLDIAFPHRANKTFGAASFALVFLMAVLEIEALVLLALGVVAHRFDLFITLQQAVLPAACVVAFATALVFWWRARSWSRKRVQSLSVWAGGGSAFGERLAKSRQQPQ